MESKRNVLVGISGASSSGKTSVANILNKLIPNSVIIHEDDFYLPDNEIPFDAQLNEYNWDSPKCIKFDEFKKTLREIRKGGYKYEVDSLEIETNLKISKSCETEIKSMVTNLNDVNVIIVEGFLLFHDKEIIDILDLKIFFKSDYKTLYNRRNNRTGYNTVSGFWEDPPNYFENIVWPEYFRNHSSLFKHSDRSISLEDEVKLNGGLQSEFAVQNKIAFIHNSNDGSFDNLILNTINYIIDNI